MLSIKVVCFCLISFQFASGKSLKLRDADYEASGDYFEAATVTGAEETTKQASSSEEDSDDGVTCSETNVTKVLSSYELENYVLVLFKVNVTANEKELL